MNQLKIIFFLTIFTLPVIALSEIDNESCKPRLVIGSGNKVNVIYPEAGRITKCNVTIDIEAQGSKKYIAPTHVLDITELKEVANLAKKYPQKFHEIIFEHVGDGPASFIKSELELVSMLKNYISMLRPSGVFLYQSYRGSLDFSGDGFTIDLTIPSVIEDIYFPVLSVNKQEYLKTSERLDAVIKYYYDIFESSGFEEVRVQIKEDPKYFKFHPTKYPYYYLEITAVRP